MNGGQRYEWNLERTVNTFSCNLLVSFVVYTSILSSIHLCIYAKPRHRFVYPIISEFKKNGKVSKRSIICETLHTDMLAHSRGNLIKVNRHTTRYTTTMCMCSVCWNLWYLNFNQFSSFTWWSTYYNKFSNIDRFK